MTMATDNSSVKTHELKERGNREYQTPTSSPGHTTAWIAKDQIGFV